MSKSFEPKPLTPEQAQIIREEHERLKSLLNQIESTPEIEALLPKLEELRGVLGEHFEHEEDPGAFGSAGAEPRFAGQVEELFEEHALFLRMVDDLISQCHKHLEGAKDVARGVTELARQLHEHEGKENALMLDLADTDLGGLG